MKIEDRVFGTPDRWPAPARASRLSTRADLFSTVVEGAQVVYASEGTAVRPPLVFVHGWAATWKFWRRTFPAFSPRWRCVAPDLVGFGLSDKPRRDYSMEGLAGWLAGFFDALEIDRAPLVGHSMGATISLLFALAHPDRVERLVLVNPVVHGPTAFRRIQRFLCFPGIRRLSWAFAHLGAFRRWIHSILDTRGILTPELQDDVIAGTFYSMFTAVGHLKTVDLRDRIASLKVRTLLIGTDEDTVVAPAQQELLSGIPKATIRGTDHIPMLERPDEFNARLDEFLTG